MQPSRSQLLIRDLCLLVHLGCTSEERAALQEVRYNIDILFDEPPPGESSDRLEHTVCYAEVCEQLKELVGQSEFNLVESLGKRSLEVLEKKYPQAKFKMSVHKLRPPIAEILGGVKYVCYSQ